MQTRVIRLFPDYGCGWPLWENGNEKYLLEPDDLGLSDGLRAMLREWHDLWEAHHHWETGWDSGVHREAWIALGERVERALAQEIREFATVSPEWRG